MIMWEIIPKSDNNLMPNTTYSVFLSSELMNGMYRVESDNSVDADEPIMKHMTEGGITILKQLERRKQTPVCIEPRYEKTGFFAYAKTKTQISFAVTAKLISAFVFATRIVQSLYFLNSEFQGL